MASPQSIAKHLDEAAALLDRAASELVDLPLQPSSDHLRRIGEALANVFEVRYHLNALDHSLTPKELRGKFQNPDGALSVALSHSRAAEQSGHPEMAIALLEWLAVHIGTVKHAEAARAEIARLRLKGRDD